MVKLAVLKIVPYFLIGFIFFWSILPVIGLIPEKYSIPRKESLEAEKSLPSQESLSSEESSVPYVIEYKTDMVDENMTFFILPGEVSVKINDTFSIQIGVENATDMFGWQVFLLFDTQILECTDIYMPSDEVFSYGVTAGEALVEYNATEFTNPIYRIYDDEGEILVGNCLLGSNQSNFNGSGILFEADFRGISTGISAIELRMRGRTYALNSAIRSVGPLPQSVYLSVNCTD